MIYQCVDRHDGNYVKLLSEIPHNKPIWATAYWINDDTSDRRLMCKPVFGEIDSFDYFHQYSKKHPHELTKTGVSIYARYFADTKEEAIRVYNELVHCRIEKLNRLILEADADIIDDQETEV